ncbi:MAG TPA: TetR/AcrR family transcriptional regulator [Acidimicrobiales bacterium]
MSEAQPSTSTPRLAPEERRELLLDAARATFAERGYTQAGLAEVAKISGVSKTLLYHYFPDGRPELYREVMDRLLDELVGGVEAAVRAPTSTERRLEGVIAAVLDYFEAHPDAYRLLILEPWGSGDAGVVGQAVAVRARLAAQLDQLIAPAGQPLARTMAGGAAALGALLHVCELWMSGQLTKDEAHDGVCRFVEAGLHALDLL